MIKHKRKNVSLGLGGGCQVQVVVLSCDGCGARLKGEPQTDREAHARAAAAGWQVSHKGELCPACAPPPPPPAPVQRTLF